jgi:protein arginine kinase activator
MPKPKECSHCQKQATIHLTQIVDNQIIKVDFCEDCVYKNQVLDQDGLSLSELVAETLGVAKSAFGSPNQTGLTCANCGLTQKDFQKYGRLGCAHCYGTFRTIINPILEEVQSGQNHVGKIPQQSPQSGEKETPPKTVELKATVNELQKALTLAISEEHYEQAAELRDRINALKMGKK